MNVSWEIIKNIGQALRLTPDERNHLIQLWTLTEPEGEAASSIHRDLSPQWQQILNQMSYPSMITTERSEVVAWNSAAQEIIADFPSFPHHERHLLRIVFLDPEFRRRTMNWEEYALHFVAVFRTYYDKNPDDPWYKEAVQRLSEESPDFADKWKDYTIQLKKVQRVLIQLPGAQAAVAYDINSLSNLNDRPDLHFCIYTPVAESNTDAAKTRFTEAKL